MKIDAFNTLAPGKELPLQVTYRVSIELAYECHFAIFKLP